MPAPDEGLDILKALAENPSVKFDVDDRPEAGVPFKLTSEFEPAGDQPQAISELIEGIEGGSRDQVLARRHRLRQDLHHGACHPEGAETNPGSRPEQDPGSPALR